MLTIIFVSLGPPLFAYCFEWKSGDEGGGKPAKHWRYKILVSIGMLQRSNEPVVIKYVTPWGHILCSCILFFFSAYLGSRTPFDRSIFQAQQLKSPASSELVRIALVATSIAQVEHVAKYSRIILISKSSQVQVPKSYESRHLYSYGVSCSTKHPGDNSHRG